MPVKDCQTEKLILDTAARVFFAEGRMNATTQDIADAAGLSRTLIHYYFRSKKALVDAVIKSTMRDFKSSGDQILSSDVPFREKTARFVDDFLESQGRYPYFEAFVTTYKIREGYEDRDKSGPHYELSAPMNKYLHEIGSEMDNGTIPRSHPVHFVMNMFSLMAYPVLMSQMYRRLFHISEEEYSKILKERKQLIMNILFPVMETGLHTSKR